MGATFKSPYEDFSMLQFAGLKQSLIGTTFLILSSAPTLYERSEAAQVYDIQLRLPPKGYAFL